jgi:hypothetical protein
MAGPIRAVPIFDPIVQDAKPHIAAKVAELHLQERLADHDRFDVQFPCLPAREGCPQQRAGGEDLSFGTGGREFAELRVELFG